MKTLFSTNNIVNTLCCVMFTQTWEQGKLVALIYQDRYDFMKNVNI